MFRLLFHLLLLITTLVNAQTLLAQSRLAISGEGTHLIYQDGGAPFFYLADTAWELLHRCDYAETKTYLADRKKKGFNTIQCVVRAELEGLTTPNAEGALALINQDPTRPNEAYFTHVDRVVRLADSLGLFLALLPTWGDKFNLKWGVGPEVFDPTNAETFARFLGERYADNNVIWILGGDRNPEEPEDFAIIRAMARGIRAVVGDRQLITYHPQGGYSSADFFAEDDWIDFHMFQTGHGRLDDKANYDFPRRVRALKPAKPVINGEPAYEDHPINWRPVNGWFDDFDTRQVAWWSVLAGTVGHTFGNHNIWQMWRPGREPISVARTDWHEALHYPGAAQIGHLGRFMEQLPYWKMTVDFNFLNAAPNSSGREVLLSKTEDASIVIAYTPYGDTLEVEEDKLRPDAKFYWFNPRTGTQFRFQPGRSEDKLLLDPPLDPRRGNDWVLLIR
ncbi:DUF4038 domain-containing protein [Lewinella sp. W8]|uniref:apiosidase-like domain-containing protein n=1 Tax=Lewinella sp. W8 TaxID=2528208 RepID=UPI001068513B|nr:DUF4038 domain-containing protein [Lewinella sp. W8]MTB51458.1 DUF4038 domain-containing protein [Lewinella sp. W8]